MKKFLSVLLTICLFAISIVPVMATEDNDVLEYSVGDVDLDGRITVKDATLIQKFIAALVDLHQDQYTVADVDNNGDVNVKDATMIQKKIADIISEFPVRDEESKDEVSTTPDETMPETPTEPITTESTTVEPTEIPTEEPTDTTVPTTEVPTTPTKPEATEPTTTDPVEEPTEPTTNKPIEEPTKPIATEPTTVEPVETPTEVPTTTPVEPTEPATTEPTECPTEPTTERPTEEPAVPETSEPTTVEPTEIPTEEPTEPFVPNMENCGPIDPIEGDMLTAEMLWTIEEEFLRLLNEERLSLLGGTELKHNKFLDAGAEIRSTEILFLYDHVRPDGSRPYTAVSGYDFFSRGENIYVFYLSISLGGEEFVGSEEQLKAIANFAFTDFKNSREHYRNMTSGAYKDVGIGIYYDYEYGSIRIAMANIFGREHK